MIAARIEGTTRVLGKAQGFLGLSILDMEVEDKKVMVSAWEPTPEELKLLNEGAKVRLYVLGTVHPAVDVRVGMGHPITEIKV